MPISRLVDKTTMRHLHSGIVLNYKEEEKFVLGTAWVNLENIMLYEIGQSEKDK